MLFKDILDSKTKILEPEFDKLFDTILKNQTHLGDLLLVEVNGFYNPEVHTWTITPKLSPYMIGLDKEGHSERLHYEFIHNYRTGALAKITHNDYLKELEWKPEKKKQIEESVEFEGISIQLEMLIYLKIWEADAFIKRFYQITKLAHGEDYDWHFKIAESNRDSYCTGTRQDILRKLVRDRFQNSFPSIYNSFKVCYKTQIRNSIAHSKYSFLGRNIHLNNYIQQDPHSQIKVVSFDEWINIFHETIVLYNQYIRFFNKVNEHYGKIAEQNNLLFEIRINRKDPSISTELRKLLYRPEFKDWNWYRP